MQRQAQPADARESKDEWQQVYTGVSLSLSLSLARARTLSLSPLSLSLSLSLSRSMTWRGVYRPSTHCGNQGIECRHLLCAAGHGRECVWPKPSLTSSGHWDTESASERSQNLWGVSRRSRSLFLYYCPCNCQDLRWYSSQCVQYIWNTSEYVRICQHTSAFAWYSIECVCLVHLKYVRTADERQRQRQREREREREREVVQRERQTDRQRERGSWVSLALPLSMVFKPVCLSTSETRAHRRCWHALLAADMLY